MRLQITLPLGLGFKLFFFSLVLKNLLYLLIISAVHLKVYFLLFIEHLGALW